MKLKGSFGGPFCDLAIMKSLFTSYKRAVLPLLLLIVVTHKVAIAQGEGEMKVDSLKTLLEKAANDSNKVNLLNSLSYSLHSIDPDDGLAYANQALELSRKLKWLPGQAAANNNLGVNSKTKSDYPSALHYYLDALDINRRLKNRKSEASNLSNIGVLYLNQGDSARAEDNLSQALKINQQLGNTKGIALNLDNLGNLYEGRNDYTRAIEYANRALGIYEELGNTNEIAKALSNLATKYSSQNKFGPALAYNFRALRLFAGYGNRNGRAVTLGNIGEIYFTIASRPDSALRPDSLISRDRRVDLKKAIEYLKGAIVVSNEIGFLKGVMKFNRTLSKAYSFSGDDKHALAAFKEYANLHDTVFSAEANRKIKTIENQKERALKEMELTRSRADAANKKKNMYLLMVGICVLAILLLFLFRERRKSEALLLNILPRKVADRLKLKEHPIADHYHNVSIMFIDMVGFTEYSGARHPKEVVSVLNDIFTHFDTLAEKYGLEKIKTIGDCYMAVSGVPDWTRGHSIKAAAMALEVKETMFEYKTAEGVAIHFRIGLEAGPVVAGVIGKKKFIYDLWGDAVNIASRMEMTGVAREIHCTDNFKREVESMNADNELKISFTARGAVEVKGRGTMETWLIS